MDKEVDMEFVIGQMVHFMRENGKMTKDMDMED